MSLRNAGIVFLVGAGPGDPGLITVKGLHCLEIADVVVYDRLANPCLLDFASKALWLDVGKQPDHHKVPQSKINKLLIEHASQGKTVVRLKGGDPFVFGRGGEEAAALAEAGVSFEIVPGVTSAIAAPAYAGIPITHRDRACSVAFITGHRANNNPDCAIDWTRLANGADTLVFLMGVHNLPEIVRQLLAGGRSPETPVALIEQGTLACQKTVVGNLETIVELGADIRPPAIILVGDVVDLRQELAWYEDPDRRPLLGLRVLNARSEPGCVQDGFIQRLQELGAQALVLTTTVLHPLKDPAAVEQMFHRLSLPDGDPGFVDWLAFTSDSTVNYFFQALMRMGYDARQLSRVRLAAFGQPAVAAMARFQLMPDFISRRATSQDRVEEFANAYPINGLKILVPQSGVAPDEFPGMLQAMGALVDVIAVCDVVPAGPTPIILDLLLSNEIDIVTFFSTSALTDLATQLAQNDLILSQVLAGVLVACSDSNVAQAAREYGLQVAVVPDVPDEDGMLAALLQLRQSVHLAPSPV